MCGRFMFHTKVKEFLLTLKQNQVYESSQVKSSKVIK